MVPFLWSPGTVTRKAKPSPPSLSELLLEKQDEELEDLDAEDADVTETET